MKIIFAGTPDFGIPCLNALALSKHQIKAIYTQPDRPAGRGRKLQASPIKEWALQHGVPIYQPQHFKDKARIDELTALNPDIIIVIAYGLILPRTVLEIPRFGCINVHASLLPRWRGASPIQHAILHGDKESGITVMQMDTGMDTGDMLLKLSVPIEQTDTASTLHNKLARISPHALLSTLDSIEIDQCEIEKQLDENSCYAPKIKKEHALIDWSSTAIAINQQVRAYNPWPHAYTLHKNTPLKIHEAHVDLSQSQQMPGSVLRIDKKGLLVATSHHCLLITKIQFPGTKILDVAQWINSSNNPINISDVFHG